MPTGPVSLGTGAVFRQLAQPYDCRTNATQEAKPYKQDPEIVSMTNLVAAFQRNDINEFERILRTNK